MNADQVNKAVELIDRHKQSFLKACQYSAIFLAWFQQRKSGPKSLKFNYYFNIYMTIFHSRKLFRLLKTLFYIPQIKQIIISLQVNFSFMKLFELLGKIFTSQFYLLDNITIISMKMGFKYYKAVRRVSHVILFIGIVFCTISLFIELRESFSQEADLKGELENMTPTELLHKISAIDDKRRVIGVRLLKIFGDLFPTLARTNLPEIIVRTKINKGTVGFFGVISALTQIYLKNREYNLKKLTG